MARLLAGGQPQESAGVAGGLSGGPRPEVFAAGGVLWRDAEGGAVEVAVIHRPAYDDWSFPKGKRHKGETDETCASREVAEETGYTAETGVELSPTAYRDPKGRWKQVRYWSMRAGPGAFHPSREVDELRWLPLDRAAGLLTHEHDRRLLDDLVERAQPES